MSRSHKKHHICKDENDSFFKRQANKVLRKVDNELVDTLQGKGYRRHYCSWYISDYSFDVDLVDYKYDENGKYSRDWRKWFYNK